MRALFLGMLLLFAALPVAAQTDAPPRDAVTSRARLETQIKNVEAALKRINAEQQSVMQQFQMVQEMRRNELQTMQTPPLSAAPTDSPPNYDDMVRNKQAQQDRLLNYSTESDRLYGRYRELEEQKRPLLDQLGELTQKLQ